MRLGLLFAKTSKSLVLSLLAGLLVSIPLQVVAPSSAQANLLGTVYEAPNMAFGGGNGPYPANCPAGQVVVGVTFNQNPMVWGHRCAPLNPDGTISPLTTALRNTSGFVFCPDGTAAVGMRMINVGGLRLALVCRTPPGMDGTEQVTQFVRTQGSPMFYTRVNEAISLQSMCNSGDVMMGTTTWQNLWFDQLRSRCAPFNRFTVTYNANGGSGVVPSVQTQSGPAAAVTLSSPANTFVRSGFRFGGWNTLANGLGTNYQPGSTITPTANTTLFAQWESKITYDANGATSGEVPADTLMTGSSNTTSLATNSGNLTRTGYTFGGWNTLANGSGTTYPVPTPAVINETPYMHFLASNFNDSTNSWANNGDAARNIPGTAVTASTGNVRGDPKIVVNQSGTNGSNKTFSAVQGGTGDGIILGNPQLNSYTFCHVARYAGSTRGRIFAGLTGNWLSGFWAGHVGVAHHEGWITNSSGWNDTNWRVQCATGSTTSGNSSHRVNGVDRTTVTTNTTPFPANVTINSQGSRNNPTTDLSDWAVAEFYVFDSVLSNQKILHLEAMLNHKYGLTGFTASTLDTFDYASTGDVTLYAQWNSIITYNGNGQTSLASTVPAQSVIRGVGTTSTLANQGSMLRTGYTFSGWNTLADGTGTNYAPGSTITASGNMTLFARWIAKIDYNVNSGSGSSDPTTASYLPGVTSIPVSDLAAIGTMTRPGFKMGGWNTKADGSGITYPEKAQSFALPTSYMHLLAENFNDASNAWSNAQGSTGPSVPGTAVTSSTAGSIRGNPTRVTTTANSFGASQSFPAVKGGVGDGILLGNEELRSFTFCHVARYTPGPNGASGTKGAIFVALDSLWFTGHWSNRTGAAHFNTWIVNSSGLNSGVDHWKVNCATGSAGSNSSSFRENGVDITTVFNYRTSLPANMTINLHANRNSPAYTSDWEVAEAIVYDSVLSEGQLRLLETTLCNKYGITCATPNLSYPITGDAILYAKWHANSYKVTYDTTNVTTGSMPTTSFTAGTQFALRTNTFTRTGFSFRGWNTQANGSGTAYLNGANVTLFGDLTLYPQWNLLLPGVPTVTTVAGNTEVTVTPTSAAASGTVGAPNSYTVTAFNSSGVALTNPTRTCTVVLPATSCVITGLTNGVTYNFSATATNATGSSTSSTQVSGTPQGVVVNYNATSNSGSLSTAAISARALTSNVATLTTTTPHGLTVGSRVVITNVDTTFNGTYNVSAVPSATTFSYIRTASNVSSTNVSPNGVATYASSETFNKGTALVLPSANRSGFTFAGWYTAASGGTLLGGAGATYSTVSNSSITNKSLTSNVATLTTATPHGLAVGGEVVITNVDSTFNGTYTITAVGSPTTFSYEKTATNVTSSLVSPSGTARPSQVFLFAQFVGITYTITYNGNGNTGGTVPSTATFQVGGSAHSVLGGTNPPTKTGYTFAGWTRPGITAYYPSGPQTNVQLSTLSNGGWTRCYSDLYSSSIDVAKMKADCTSTYIMFAAAEIGTAGDATTVKSNTFRVLAAGERASVFRATSINSPILNNGTYWFHTSGTSLGFDPDSSISQNQCYDGGPLSLCWHWVSGSGGFSAGGTVVGNTNSGWVRHVYQTNEVASNFAVGSSISPLSNITLMAQWTADTNSISYNRNGGTGDLPITGSYVTGAATPYTVLARPNNLVRNGFEFVGWNTSADGTGTDHLATGTATLTTAQPLILYAKWRPITYSFRYELNGGTSQQPSAGTALFSETITVASAPSRSGFTFSGWNDGTSTKSAGETVTVSSNIVFVAQWTAQSFAISYNGNGASSGSTSSGSFTAGGVATPIALNGFSYPGYTFLGWNTAANGSGASYLPGAGYATAAALNLFAQWGPASYTITYNANGATSGTVPTSATLTTGVAFQAAGNSGGLARTGFTFNGWNTAADGSGTQYMESATVTTTQNLTLFARWSIINTQINFSQGIATVTPTVFPSNTSRTFGTLYVLPQTDTSTVINSASYRFSGWSDGTNTYAPGDGFRVGQSSVTFTAQWIQIFSVKYVLNGGTGNVPGEVLRTDGFGETLTATVPIRAGFNFAGWRDQSNNSIPSGSGAWTISTTSYIAYAQWTAVPVTLTFNLNGGTGAVSPITPKFLNEVVQLPNSNSSRTGYTFGGWQINPTIPEGGTYVVGDAPTQGFTAVWNGNTNTISYNGNGATGGTVPQSGTYVTGASPAYTVLSNSGNLERTGFSFIGWNTAANGSGTSYAATGSDTLTATSDVILYAQWSATSFAVTYDTAGGSPVPSSTTAAFGSTFTLPAAPTLAGSNFLGWENVTGGIATLHAPGSSYTMGSAAVAFTAKWSGLSYVIAYSLNGGSGTAPTQSTVGHLGNFVVAPAVTRDGFTFSGWSDGSTTRSPGSTVTNVTSNMTLVAQWSIAAPGVPGAPTAIAGDSSAVVTVVAPTTGGTPSSYTVTASPGGATCTVISPATSCTISSLANGTNYTFTSQAFNTAGNSISGNSNVVMPAGLPSAPQGISGSGIGASATISWGVPDSDGGAAIIDYVVEYSASGANSWTTFNDGLTTNTTATVTGLTAGTSYQFRVSARNSIGNSLPSLVSPIIDTLPASPSIGALTAGDETVTVTWSAPTHIGSKPITAYTVTAYNASGQESGSCSPNPLATSCTVENLVNGQPYTFRVSATTDAGTSALSQASVVGTPATTPSAPSNVEASASANGMTVTFTAPTDVGGAAISSYTITSSPAGANCVRSTSDTTYLCTGLTAGTNYTYSVRATNRIGNSAESLPSTAVTALGVPTAPQNVSAEITASGSLLSAAISFSPPANERGSAVISYTVTASPGGASCTVQAPTAACVISGLIDRAYTFSVTATNGVGQSLPSAATSSTLASNGSAPTLDNSPIPAPSGLVDEGALLTSSATYTALPTEVITYVWKRCNASEDASSCSDIPGATSRTYRLTANDADKFIRVQTTATNSLGSRTDLSDPTEVIVAAPVSAPAPNPAPNPVPNPAPNPAPEPAPVCDAICVAQQRAAAERAAAERAAAEKAALEKAAADKAAAEKAAQAAKEKADTNKKAEEVNQVSSKKAEEAKAAAEKFVEKIAEATQLQLRLQEAATDSAERAKAARDAKSAAEKAAADAKRVLDSKNASAAEKAAASDAAKKAERAAKREIASAAAAAKEEAALREAANKANRQVDIAINSLTSKTATARATAEANRIALAAKRAAVQTAKQAAVRADNAQASAQQAQRAAREAADELVAIQERSLVAANELRVASQDLNEVNLKLSSTSELVKQELQVLSNLYSTQAEKAKLLAVTEDAVSRQNLNSEIEKLNGEIAQAERSVLEKQAQIESLQNTAKATELKVSILRESSTRLLSETVKARNDLSAKTAIARSLSSAAEIAVKAAAAAKKAADALPRRAIIQTKPSSSNSKNRATATITGLKPGQKIKVIVNVGNR